MLTSMSLTEDDLQLASLKGKSVLITGGASGLGHQTAKLFAKSGAYVTIADVQPSEPVVESFKAQSLAIQYVHCDVRDWSQQVVAFKQAINFAPSRTLDVVCSFAGVDKQGHLIDHVKQTEAAVNDEPIPPNTDELEINLKGTLYTTDLALHYFRLPGRPVKKTKKPLPVRSVSSSESDNENKDDGKEVEAKSLESTEPELLPAAKSLIIVSSMSGYVYDPVHSIYTASKFGSRGLFIAVSAEAEKQLNVRCNLIAPWAIQTSMTLPILQKMEQAGFLLRDEPGAKEQGKEKDKEKENETIELSSGPDTEQNEKTEEPAAEKMKDDPTEISTQDATTQVEDDNHQITTELPTNTNTDIDIPASTPKAPTDPETKEAEVGTEAPEPTTQPEEKQQDQEQEQEQDTTTQPDDDIPTATNKNGESEPGVKYKGMSFARGSDLAKAVARCCTDTSISGRAFAIMPEGVFDLGDDLEGGYAGDAIRELMAKRKEAGDMLSG